MTPPPPQPDAPSDGRDRGYSLTEILVAVVLLGVTVTAVMVTLRVTVRASVTDRDHAAAFAWLQAASDGIHGAARVPCTAGQSSVVAAYDVTAQAVAAPPVWAGEGASIAVSNVEFLGRSSPDADLDWSPAYCFEGGAYAASPLPTQRVTLTATSPNGRVVETLQMVKTD